MINVYEAFNSLGFSVGKFNVIGDGRDIPERELNEIAERMLRCEVVTRCEQVDTLDIWGRSLQDGKKKLRRGKKSLTWGLEEKGETDGNLEKGT